MPILSRYRKGKINKSNEFTQSYNKKSLLTKKKSPGATSLTQVTWPQLKSVSGAALGIKDRLSNLRNKIELQFKAF